MTGYDRVGRYRAEWDEIGQTRSRWEVKRGQNVTEWDKVGHIERKLDRMHRKEKLSGLQS